MTVSQAQQLLSSGAQQIMVLNLITIENAF